MAANKFATMLHRRTNKITLILIYAVLEWILIVLLLLNSLFSYLIVKFAIYFGLKPPCLWCSRIDHMFGAGENKNMHRDLLCEAHAREISGLVFCSNHRKLAESRGMCEDCLSSGSDSHSLSATFGFVPWMKRVGFVRSEGDKVSECDEVILKCSCCGLSSGNKNCPPYVVIKPSWGILDYSTLDGNLITGGGDDVHTKEDGNLDPEKSESVADQLDDEQVKKLDREIEMLFDVNAGFDVREEKAEDHLSVPASVSEIKLLQGNADDEKVMIQGAEDETSMEEDESDKILADLFSDQAMFEETSCKRNASLETLPQHLEFFLDCGGNRLIPVELIDSATEEEQSNPKVRVQDQQSNDHQKSDFVSGLCVMEDDESIAQDRVIVKVTEGILEPVENKEEHKAAVVESMEVEDSENSPAFHAESCDSVGVANEEDANSQETKRPPRDVEIESATIAEEEGVSDFRQAEVAVRTEIIDLNTKEETGFEENFASCECPEGNASTSSTTLNSDEETDSRKARELSLESKTSLVEVCEHARGHQLSLSSELNEIDEEKVPDTPTSTESFHHLHKKLILLGRKDSGTEESMDGSTISEFEGGDGPMTIERLKTALRAERKALHALYGELQEERNASAVAASQTMAMINRLQEEKAAMQMEALQYQRMMEEQSDYDQEALQLLNELMIKREREKQELEKELEVCRKRLLDYEAKERVRVLRRSRDGSARSETSSASCSNTEDSDAQSVDLNQEVKEDIGIVSHHDASSHHHTPPEGVLNLEESLADFEEERLSILDQLKALEEKLMTLSDEEESHFDKVSPIEHFQEENGVLLDNPGFGSEVNDHANGFHKEKTGKHFQERTMGSNAKRLLPLFDAVDGENMEEAVNGIENGHSTNGEHKNNARNSELENIKVDIEEEVDHLYRRLEVLEADREFLKHCIGSLKKGDKGMDLLQEILQHLRDLRNMELRAKNLSEASLL